jgi:hypothetical protein
VEGVRLHCTVVLEMSRFQCYAAFVKATNDIGMQDKWIPDDNRARHIRNEDGLKDCKVSHNMNRSISSKCLFTNNRYISQENNKTILWNKQRIVPKKSTAI